MVVQMTDRDGRQIKSLDNPVLDVELNSGERDFQLTLPIVKFDECMQYGCRIFVANTEIGGILGSLSTDTAAETFSWSGFTWRGLMKQKIIIPPEGQEYLSVSGELNSVLRDLIEPMFGGVFVVSEIDTGIDVSNYKFVPYCTLLEGLSNMLKEVGCRLEIRYNEGEPNQTGYVEVQAIPIRDYSHEIELSQDSRLNFRMQDKRNGVNHLIVLGNDELKERPVVHLYVQEDGGIDNVPHYIGIDEIIEIYESSSDDVTELRNKGAERLKELMNKKTFEMNVETLGIDVAIGDIIGGRDHITGMYMAKPIQNIIVKIENGNVRKEYKEEGI